MGKENINFLTAWIILGNVFATFSTDPEPTAISNSTGSPTEFGKSGTSTATSLSKSSASTGDNEENAHGPQVNCGALFRADRE